MKQPRVASTPLLGALSQRFEYRSRWTLLGLPLLHVRMNCRQDGKELPAQGWIAVGGVAYGALFALGTVAIAPISLGGAFAVGLFSVGGGMAVGLLSIGGGLSLGAWALGGGLAVGVFAFGGCAIGWTGAMGGVAVAHEFARGGLAYAHIMNTDAVQSYFQEQPFFQWGMRAAEYAYRFGLAAVAGVLALEVFLRRVPSNRNKPGP